MLLFARPETCHGWNVFETTSCGKLGRGLFAYQQRPYMGRIPVGCSVIWHRETIQPYGNNAGRVVRTVPCANLARHGHFIKDVEGSRGRGFRGNEHRGQGHGNRDLWRVRRCQWRAQGAGSGPGCIRGDASPRAAICLKAFAVPPKPASARTLRTMCVHIRAL